MILFNLNMAEMMESNRYKLTTLSETCILHSLHVLSSQNESDMATEQLKPFYKEIEAAVYQSNTDLERTKTTYAIPTVCLTEGARKAKDTIAQHINKHISSKFDYNRLFRACWKVYRMEKRPDTTVTEFSRWHPVDSDDCMYHLWLIFNAILLPDSDEMKINVKYLDEIMKRLFDLCGHECSRQDLVYSTTTEKLEYPDYLKAIANYTVKFGLKSALTCEVSGFLNNIVLTLPLAHI